LEKRKGKTSKDAKRQSRRNTMIYDLYKGTGAALEVEGGRLNKAVDHGSRSFPDGVNTNRKVEHAFLLYNV